MDLALLSLRIVLGVVLFAHAAQKTLGWFGGAGLEAMVPAFEKLGQRPGRPMVILASVSECVAAIGLLLGLLVPLAGAIATGTMLVAGYSLTAVSSKFWNAQGGGEYPFFIAAMALVAALSGGGHYSLDQLFGAPWVAPSPGQAALIGVAAMAVAIAAAAGPVSRTRRTLAIPEA